MNFWSWLIYRIIGTPSERLLKRFTPVLERANAFEDQVKTLPDSAFPEKTAELKARLADALSDVKDGVPRKSARP